ncbi:MAG: hypothetical protein IID41_10525 [Planctomycetes bacterium]|nr:hypothetical protein [Planctomycetota bacterium]
MPLDMPGLGELCERLGNTETEALRFAVHNMLMLHELGDPDDLGLPADVAGVVDHYAEALGLDAEHILRYVFSTFLGTPQGRAMNIISRSEIGRDRFKKTLTTIENVTVPA